MENEELKKQKIGRIISRMTDLLAGETPEDRRMYIECAVLSVWKTELNGDQIKDLSDALCFAVEKELNKNNQPTCVNVNEYVWVEITDYGWDVLEKFYYNLFNLPGIQHPVQKIIDEQIAIHKKHTKEHIVNGEKINLTEMQLHEFMNIFGSKMYCGAVPVITNNNIYFNVK